MKEAFANLFSWHAGFLLACLVQLWHVFNYTDHRLWKRLSLKAVVTAAFLPTGPLGQWSVSSGVLSWKACAHFRNNLCLSLKVPVCILEYLLKLKVEELNLISHETCLNWMLEWQLTTNISDWIWDGSICNDVNRLEYNKGTLLGVIIQIITASIAGYVSGRSDVMKFQAEIKRTV